MKISTLIAIYFTNIVVSIIMLLIYKKYSTNKLVINKKMIIKLIIMSTIYFLNNFMYPQVKIITSTIIAFLMFKWIFNDDIKTTIYYTLIITIILHCIDLSFVIFLPHWIKNIGVLNQSLIFKVGYSIFVNTILYVIIGNKYAVSFFKKIKTFTNSYKLFYLIGFIALIICNVWSFYLAEDAANKTLNIVLTVSELTILFFAIIVLKYKYEQSILEIKEEQLKQNLSLYSKVANEYKELKHNLMNDFLAIKTKITKKDQDFINEIINKYKSEYEWVNIVTDIPEGLQGLIFLKKKQAEMKKIHFNLEYNLTKKAENLYALDNDFKLYESLGILLDNAIEGAYESKEKLVNILFSYSNNILKISIFNTFNNAIDLEKIGNKNYSTKNRGSGIGLNYIKKQKKKFSVVQSIKDNIFITEITFKVQEKK